MLSENRLQTENREWGLWLNQLVPLDKLFRLYSLQRDEPHVTMV
jgi:hypothetical protein